MRQLYKLTDDEVKELWRLFYSGKTMAQAAEYVLPWLLRCEAWRFADWASKQNSWIEYVGAEAHVYTL